MNIRPLFLFRLLLFFTLPYFCHQSMAQDFGPELQFINHIYDPHIKSAILYRADNIKAAATGSAAIPLAQTIPLMLIFDEIKTEEADYYKAKILRCEFNWTPSKLSEMQYLFQINEFNIDEYDFSIATKIPYTHFTFQVPKVKMAGNYLLVIYRDNPQREIIITKRFIVYDQRVAVRGHVGLATGITQRQQNHQINFEVDYTKLPIPNPYLDLHVILRQNNRWDNAISDLQPSHIREDTHQLVYQNFDLSQNFQAGNEFRFFDIRSVHFGGQNVKKIDHGTLQTDAYLYIDKSRGTQPYAKIKDLNGGYVIENKEGRNDFLEADYISVHFFLEMNESINNPIFVTGRLTDWNCAKENKMSYLKASGLYTCDLLIKQGIYDFTYYVPENSENPMILEGNHFETENEYDIIIYYRNQMLNTDLIVGYLKIL